MLLAFPALGAEVAGVKLDDKVGELQLNGAGLRKRVIFQVYVIGLYLPKKTNAAEEAISGPGPKRVAIHMLRDVGADQFTDALVDGMRDNNPEAEVKKLDPQIKALSATMAQIKEAKKGMAIALDMKGSETHLLVNGKPTGQPIAGEDFQRALLRIWLGPRPVQDDVKKALLGG